MVNMRTSAKSLSLLSYHLGVNIEEFEKKGILNPTYEQDVPLFIDPLLLKNSSNPLFSQIARKKYKDFFINILQLARQYTQALGLNKNILKRKIVQKLEFKEQSGTGLGYSEFNVSGRGIGKKKAQSIAKPLLRLFDAGYDFKYKNIFQIVFMLEEGIGADLISDMTASIIKNELAEFTQDISKEWKIKTRPFRIENKHYLLPEHPKTKSYVLFIPNDILDTMPAVRDFDNVIKGFSENAKETNENIRLRVSEDIENIWQEAIRDANLANPDNKTKADNNARILYKERTRAYIYENIDALDALTDYLEETNFFDEHRDFSNQTHIILSKTYPFFERLKDVQIRKNNDILKTSNEIIDNFADFISKNNDIKRSLLWCGNRCAHEKSWQAVFHLFINQLLKQNNIDITPEYETGQGPVDFKFSQGEQKKILVEIKLASNQNYAKGYNKQLMTYQKVTTGVIAAYFIFINNVGDKKFGKQVQKLINIKNKIQNAPNIILVDGMLHESASKLV